jgi:hypothetical protein
MYAYGPEAIDVADDVSFEDLGKLKQQFLENQINISAQQCKNITTSTIQQSQSGLSYIIVFLSSFQSILFDCGVFLKNTIPGVVVSTE